MSVDVLSKIAKKSESRNKEAKSALVDINHDLIVAITGIGLYGKEARDEEILSIILNAGTIQSLDKMLQRVKENYNNLIKTKKLKKGKDGYMRDEDGFIRLTPR